MNVRTQRTTGHRSTSAAPALAPLVIALVATLSVLLWSPPEAVAPTAGPSDGPSSVSRQFLDAAGDCAMPARADERALRSLSLFVETAAWAPDPWSRLLPPLTDATMPLPRVWSIAGRHWGAASLARAPPRDS